MRGTPGARGGGMKRTRRVGILRYQRLFIIPKIQKVRTAPRLSSNIFSQDYVGTKESYWDSSDQLMLSILVCDKKSLEVYHIA